MFGKNLLLTLALLVAAEAASYEDSKKAVLQNHLDELLPNIANEINKECIRHISSILYEYSDAMREQPMSEANPQFETRYKTWKRNADLINSLLSLPKGMNKAGR